MKKITLSVLGATGLVGSEMVLALESFNGQLRLFASNESAGEVYKWGTEELVIQVPTKETLAGSDVILVCLPPDEARKIMPVAIESGAVVIDNSGELRKLHPECALIAPAIERGVARKKSKLFSLPSPIVAELAPVLFEISKLSPITSIRVVALYAASSAGRDGLDELWEQTRAVFTQTEAPVDVFPTQVAFNCVPWVGFVKSNSGISSEEDRVCSELKEVLKVPALKAHMTAIRVPVFHSHSVSLSVETSEKITPKQLEEALEKVPGINLHKEPGPFPHPVSVAGEDSLHIGRIVEDGSIKNALSLWVVADNIRYGAVSSMVEAVHQICSTEQ